MNVTSMLSSGYLQPYGDSLRSVEKAQSPVALSAQEQKVLVQEQALKASYGPDAKVSTTYRYSTGPDGRRYISGAVVSIEGSEQSEAAQPGGAQPNDGRKNVQLGEKGEKAAAEDPQTKEAASDEGSDEKIQAEIRELKRGEQEVIAHEAAHQAAGGALASAPTYTYTQGPDGRRYITGGEVSISAPASSDPEQTLRNMEQVQRAALAPGSPSGQDLSVAANAAAMAAGARQELAAEKRKSNNTSDDASNSEEGASFSYGVSSVKAGLMFDSLHGGNRVGENQAEEGQVAPIVEELPDNVMMDPREAYGRNASDRGLWSLARGFEPVRRAAITRPGFSIAA